MTYMGCMLCSCLHDILSVVVIDHLLITKLAYVGSPVFFCLRGTCTCYQRDSNAVSKRKWRTP